jgi:hypothetical protein
MNTVLLPFSLQWGLVGQLPGPLLACLDRLHWPRFPDGESVVAVGDPMESAPIKVTFAGGKCYVF